MKKTFAFLLATICLLSFTVAAYALPWIPSKTPSDMVVIGADEAEPPIPGGSNFVVRAASTSAATNAALAKLQAHGGSAASFFGEKAIAGMLPGGVGLNDLVVNEFITVDITSFTVGSSDVTLSFTFATPYENGQFVVAAVGVTDANGNTTWYIVTAKVQNGAVLVTFPPEVIKALNGQSFSLAILSEK